MAEALGWPQESIGFADLVPLANDPEGWGAVGHPEWGPFRLGKTNPNFSTSGLNFTIAEYYAATGKTPGLTVEDLARPAAVEFASQIESAVVHYGDITMTFLNNWFAADARGTSLTYTSVVAVEEKSVIDYNRGNPDGVLSPGEEPRRPGCRSWRSTPRRGRCTPTTRSSCSTPSGSTPTRRRRRRCSRTSSSSPENQQKVMEFGFRPNNPSRAARRPDRRGQRRRPDAADGRARGAVARCARRHPRLVGRAAQGRPGAARARHLRVDGRVGRGRRAGPGSTSPRRRRSAPSTSSRRPTTSGCGCSAPTSAAPTRTSASSCRSARSASSRTSSPSRSRPSSRPTARRCTTSPRRPTRRWSPRYDPEKINAIVLLTDGENDDGIPDDDDQQFADLIEALQAGSEGSSSQPVRLFTISYGETADVSRCGRSPRPRARRRTTPATRRRSTRSSPP